VDLNQEEEMWNDYEWQAQRTIGERQILSGLEYKVSLQKTMLRAAPGTKLVAEVQSRAVGGDQSPEGGMVVAAAESWQLVEIAALAVGCGLAEDASDNSNNSFPPPSRLQVNRDWAI
jgi:hypothetical protein